MEKEEKTKAIKKSLTKARGESENGLREIRYYKKNVYGNEHNYLHDADVAEAHHKLSGQTTLRQPHIEAYEALGHKVNHVPKN